PKKIETLVLCSGKIYYDIDKALEGHNRDSVAVVRVEQICPFPKTQLTPFINGFPKLKKVVWAQEEPQNMGAYTWIRPRLRGLMDNLALEKFPLEYIGRVERSSPAVGSARVHQKEQDEIIAKILNS